MKIVFNFAAFLLLLSLFWNCSSSTVDDQSLPFLGHHDIENGDTTYHAIPSFQFVNQDSQAVTPQTFLGKAYVTDFFFTSCPTICPKVKKQMMRIYDRYEESDNLLLLSHSIDTKYDTVGRLKQYATNLGVGLPRWHFVTGNKADIFNITEEYMSIAYEDDEAPGGFNHSGWIILVDENKHIRSFCDGTDEEAVTAFFKDIDLLLAEMTEKSE